MSNDIPLALLENTAYNNIENVSTAALHHDVDYASDLNPNEPIYSDRNKRATCPYPTTTEERAVAEKDLILDCVLNTSNCLDLVDSSKDAVLILST